MAVQVSKHHAFDSAEVTDKPIVGNAGLAAVGRLMRIAGVDRVCSDRNFPNQKIQDADVVKVMCGLTGIHHAPM
jgi:hypothetical protein